MASNSYVHACGVPVERCSGSIAHLNHGLDTVVKKAHHSPPEAQRCYKRWLISEGYAQVGPREFQKPGEPILVLTKASRFGGRLRKGKSGEKSGQGGHRNTPAGRGGGLISSL